LLLNKGMERQEGSRKILIVEDEKDLRLVYSRLFSGRGYDVETAVSGPDAIAKIRGYTEQNRPDGFLVDIWLPDESGYGVIRAIRENPVTEHRPVIAMSATTEANLEKARGAGADTAYRKPFDFKKVAVCMDELISADEELGRSEGV